METRPVTAAWVKSPARAVVKNTFKKNKSEGCEKYQEKNGDKLAWEVNKHEVSLIGAQPDTNVWQLCGCSCGFFVILIHFFQCHSFLETWLYKQLSSSNNLEYFEGKKGTRKNCISFFKLCKSETAILKSSKWWGLVSRLNVCFFYISAGVQTSGRDVALRVKALWHTSRHMIAWLKWFNTGHPKYCGWDSSKPCN